MKIRSCLLDENNFRIVDGITISNRLRAQGKRHLWSERETQQIDTVVFHAMSAVNIDSQRPYDEEMLLKVFCDCSVSSHYLIDRQGGVVLLVPEEKKAWHCGGSIMPYPDLRQSVNDFSIGIELVALPCEGYTDEQYDAIVALCVDLESRMGRRLIYVGHEDISGEEAVRLGLRNDIKHDPGRLFDWNRIGKILHLAAPKCREMEDGK